jgi:hypothetical protein
MDALDDSAPPSSPAPPTRTPRPSPWGSTAPSLLGTLYLAPSLASRAWRSNSSPARARQASSSQTTPPGCPPRMSVPQVQRPRPVITTANPHPGEWATESPQETVNDLKLTNRTAIPPCGLGSPPQTQSATPPSRSRSCGTPSPQAPSTRIATRELRILTRQRPRCHLNRHEPPVPFNRDKEHAWRKRRHSKSDLLNIYSAPKCSPRWLGTRHRWDRSVRS